MKPITLYWSKYTPNPSKVLMFLEELGLPYDSSPVSNEELKEKTYKDINPNGRLPAITDPNSGITLWESGAIVSYLIDTYDKEGQLSYDTFPEKYQLQQWSFFQVSGQGPYFGQAAWFNLFHPEKLESAQARYGNEIKRVAGVLDSFLKGKEWLVGDKCTYADLSFFMWNKNLTMATQGSPVTWNWDEFPEFKRWQDAMAKRPAVQKALSMGADEAPKSEGTRK